MDPSKNHANSNIIIKDKKLTSVKRCCITEVVCGGIAFIIGIILVVKYPPSPGHVGSPPTGIWAGVLVALNGIIGIIFCGRNITREKISLCVFFTFGSLIVTTTMLGLYIRDLEYVIGLKRSFLQIFFDKEITPALVMIALEVLLSIILIITVVIHLVQVGKFSEALTNSMQQVGAIDGVIQHNSSQERSVEVHPILPSYSSVGHVNPVGPQINGVNSANSLPPTAPPAYHEVGYQQPQAPTLPRRKPQHVVSIASSQY